MEIEFLIRAPKEGNDEDMEDRRIRQLVEGPGEQEDTVEFVYRPYTLEMNDILTFGDYDSVHTELRTNTGYYYPQIHYEHFKSIYQTVTGRNIKAVSDFKFIRNDRD